VDRNELTTQTKKTVRPGVELTFDYGDASGAGDGIPKSFTPGAQDDVNRTPCLCASTNCRGWMPYDPTL
jgi:translation elongation factor EF-Tu-like GTPase